MKQAMHGTLSLFLVTFIAMVMLLSFGVQAIVTTSQCEVFPAECNYSHLILSAGNNVIVPPMP